MACSCEYRKIHPFPSPFNEATSLKWKHGEKLTPGLGVGMTHMHYILLCTSFVVIDIPLLSQTNPSTVVSGGMKLRKKTCVIAIASHMINTSSLSFTHLGLKHKPFTYDIFQLILLYIIVDLRAFR